MAKSNRIPKSLQRVMEAKLAAENVVVNSIWTKTKMKKVRKQDIVHEVYHHGRCVGVTEAQLQAADAAQLVLRDHQAECAAPGIEGDVNA